MYCPSRATWNWTFQKHKLILYKTVNNDLKSIMFAGYHLKFAVLAATVDTSVYWHLCCCWLLQWRHIGRDSVSNHQHRECLLGRLISRRSKKTSKLRVTGLCAGKSPETGEFPAQRASNAENVSIWWRHHDSGGIRAMPWLLTHCLCVASSSTAMLERSINAENVSIKWCNLDNHCNSNSTTGAITIKVLIMESKAEYIPCV